jgi:hypothetical protein
VNPPGRLGIRGFGSVTAPAGTLLPDDLDPLYQPLLGRRIRKVGRHIKLAVSGAVRTLQNAGLTALPSARTGVFLGSALGNLPDVVAFTESVLGAEGPPVSPTQFANSVANSAAFHVAQSFGIVGPVLAVGQDEVSFECALLNAQALLLTGELDYALVGGIDVYWPEDDAQRRRMGYETDSPVTPGEGSGWLLVERPSADSVATLEEVALLHPGNGRTVAGHAARHGTPALLAAGTRPRQGRLLEGLPPGIELLRTTFGSFVAESGALVCALLEDGGRRGLPLHAVSETREGLVGVVTLRGRAGREDER